MHANNGNPSLGPTSPQPLPNPSLPPSYSPSPSLAASAMGVEPTAPKPLAAGARRLAVDWLQVDFAYPTLTGPTNKGRCTAETHAFRTKLAALRAGTDDSFVELHVTQPNIHEHARRLGQRVRTWKTGEGGFRVWRVK